MIDIKQLKPLPPFSWQDAQPRDIDLGYFSFYHIDFTEPFGAQLQHHFGVMPLAAYDIAVHYFRLPSNTKTVVFLHGYFDHTGLYAPLFLMLLENGFNILTYDLPGHGLSSGEQAGIPDFADYQAAFKELLASAQMHLCQPLYLMGQSTGGSIAMDYVLYNPQHAFKKLVLLAPLVIPKHWNILRRILAMVGVFLNAAPRDFSKNTHNVEFLKFVKNTDPLQSLTVKKSWAKALLKWQKHFQDAPPSATPTLVLQGDKDGTVDWRYDLKQIPKKFTQLKIVILSGARHHIANESEFYRNQLFDEIKTFLLKD